jgi:PEP-CTERM motif
MTTIAALGSTQHAVCVPGWNLEGNTAGLWAHCQDGNEVADLFSHLKPTVADTPVAPPHEMVDALVRPPRGGVIPPGALPENIGESPRAGIPAFNEDGSPFQEADAKPAGNPIGPSNFESPGIDTPGSGFGPPPSSGEPGPILQCAGCSKPSSPSGPGGGGSTGPSGPGGGGSTNPSGPGGGGSTNPGGPSGPTGGGGSPPAGGVPEPSIWVMLIAGFGLAGLMQRKTARKDSTTREA